MTANGWLQILAYLAIILAVTRPLGRFMRRVYEGERTWGDVVLRPVERLLYRVAGVDETREMRWTEYAVSVLIFGFVSLVVLYALQRLQGWLPLNPQGFGAVPPALAFNTAASFATNTNWQAYGGESTMSYLTQMAGLAYQNFMSAATGMAVAAAVIRGIARRESQTIGNFWVDLTRSVLWILLPVSLVGALALVSQGVPQNFRPYDTASLIDPQAVPAADEGGATTTKTIAEQVIAQGPVASQEIIKQFGTNGGGFFSANAAHPFENPTPLSNFFSMIAILAVSAGFVYMLGEAIGSTRHGWIVWGAMAIFLVAGVAAAYWAEAAGNPLLAGANQMSSSTAPGGNMEGKEVRFGIAATALFATVTTDASCGAVNGMHDSFTPLGGMVPLVNIMLGEVIFGGVGAGLYGMLVFIVLAVFIAGLMVGRTPEYVGKPIESFDVQMAMVAVLVFPLTVLVFTGISAVAPFATSSVTNPGPHGLSQMLYAFVSGAGNNGSAFAGLGANTDWYNVTIGVATLAGRYGVIVPVLALAGNLARKKRTPPSPGTFPVTGPLFGVLLAGVILIVGALTFFPALSLGPVVEHLLMHRGQTF